MFSPIGRLITSNLIAPAITSGNDTKRALQCDEKSIAIILPKIHKPLAHALKYNTAQRDTTNGRGWIRTSVGISQQIYSLPRLAASVHARIRPRLSEPPSLIKLIDMIARWKLACRSRPRAYVVSGTGTTPYDFRTIIIWWES